MERERPTGRGRRMIRQIGPAILLSLAKGMASAIGGAIVAGVLWWIDHR